MFRRRLVAQGLVCAPALLGLRRLTLSSGVRDTLTERLTALKEECKGQGLDLADMSDASKAASRAFQESVQKSGVEDAAFKGKIATLSASVKAYNTRLTNLQNESRSIQAEADAVLKLMWGTESPRGANFAKPPPSPPTSAAETLAEARNAKTAKKDDVDFSVDPPPVSKILETPSRSEQPVERVVGERVVDAPPHSKADGSASAPPPEKEIEVETIDIEVEPAPGAASGNGTAQAKAPADHDDPVDTMKITDITKELYEKGVNFSDCLDARSLRQRYRDMLSGKVSAGYNAATSKPASKPYTEPLNANGPSAPSSQPRMPSKPHYEQPQHQYQYSQPNTSESGLASDPYPNAQRKMVDPMKHVWEIKQELASEKGIDPASVDLWSGKTKLEDQKRLYDYPSVQNYPIEVRQKGDIPR